MNQTFLRIILSISIFTCLTSNVFASKRHYKMEVSPGGYKFYSSYKLEIPATHDHPAKKLKVHAVVGPGTGTERCINGKVFPAIFRGTLNFKQNGTPAIFEGMYRFNRKKIFAKSNFSSSSEWHKGLETIFQKVVDKQFDTIMPWLLKERNHWLHIMKSLKAKEIGVKEPETILIKAMLGCKLDATYSIRFRSTMPRKSPLAPRILVRILVQKERVASLGNKKMLTFTATFNTQIQPSIKDPKSVIKFVKAKDAFSEIGRIDLPHSASSVWYPWVKKVVKRVAVQYAKLKKIHNSATSKSKLKQNC